MNHEHPINAAQRDDQEAMARVWNAQQEKKNEDKKWREGISESNVETVAQLKKQNKHLEKLVEDSENAIEQRNVIIRFMVEEMMKSEQPKEVKKKFLMDLLVPIATVSSGAGDLMQLVKDWLELLN